MLRLVACCIAVLLMTAQVVSYVLHRGGLDDQDMRIAKLELAANEPGLNLIFIGASHTDMGLNPDAFDAEMEEQGIKIHSFNMGMNGLSVVEMRAVVERLLQMRPCCIEYVVLSPCFECLNVARRTNNVRSINFFDLESSIEFLRFINSYDDLPDPPLARSEYTKNIASALFRHYANAGLAASALRLTKFDFAEPNLRSPEFWKQRGPRGHWAIKWAMSRQEVDQYLLDVQRVPPLRAEFIATKSEVTAGIKDLVTDATFDFFARLVDDLQAKGVKVLVIQPPSFWNWDIEAAFVAKYRSRCADGPPLIDFGDAQQNPDLFLPPEIRYDNSHMNRDGAIVYSESLARKLSTLIAAGAFDARPGCKSQSVG
jgi:hypothetical protein